MAMNLVDESDDKLERYVAFYELQKDRYYVEDTLIGQTDLQPSTWEEDRYKLYKNVHWQPEDKVVETFDDLEEAKDFLDNQSNQNHHDS